MTNAWPLCVLAALAAGCGSSSPNAAAAANASGAAASAAIAGSPAPSGQAASGTVDLRKVRGGPRQNVILRLEVTEAGFFPAGRTAPPGRRYYTVGLRGMSRSDSPALLGGSKGDEVLIDARRFVFAQNERGCLSQPEFDVAGVPNLFGDSMTFSPSKEIEGRVHSWSRTTRSESGYSSRRSARTPWPSRRAPISRRPGRSQSTRLTTGRRCESSSSQVRHRHHRCHAPTPAESTSCSTSSSRISAASRASSSNPCSSFG